MVNTKHTVNDPKGDIGMSNTCNLYFKGSSSKMKGFKTYGQISRIETSSLEETLKMVSNQNIDKR